MPILIDDQKLIPIKVEYLETPGKYNSSFTFISSKDEHEKYKDDPNYRELDTEWKLLTWADHNKIYGECLKYAPGAEGLNLGNLDFMKFRDMKLKACLKKWSGKSVRDANGNPIPVSSSTIDRLHPEFANELLNVFERVTEGAPNQNIAPKPVE